MIFTVDGPLWPTPGNICDIITRETGFGDPERMRRAFVRAFGQPPQMMRRAFQLQA